MRYMIAHMIGSNARTYHENLSNVLASTYKLRPATSSIDPHLTVKSPFEALSTDIHEVEHIVERFARFTNPVPYTLNGFGTFEDRVIYMHAEGGEEMVALMESFKGELKGIPWLEFKPHERVVVPHATLCYPKDASQAKEILGRLTAHTAPTFACTLDTIAILKKGDRRWEVVKEFPLSGSSIQLESGSLDQILTSNF